MRRSIVVLVLYGAPSFACEESQPGAGESGSSGEDGSTTSAEPEPDAGNSSSSGSQSSEVTSSGESSGSSGTTSSDGSDTGGPEACGNGVLEVGEACDDANAIADDGCNSDCVRSGARLWETFLGCTFAAGGWHAGSFLTVGVEGDVHAYGDVGRLWFDGDGTPLEVAITDEGYGMMTGEAVSRGDGDLVMMHDAGALVAVKITADGDHAWSQTASDAIGEDIELVIVLTATAGAVGYAISAYTIIAGEARYLTWMLDEDGNTTYTTLEPEGGVTAIGVGPEDAFATWRTWSSVAGSLALVGATGPVQAWPTIEPPAFVRWIAAAQSEQPRWYVAGDPVVEGGALAVFALDDTLAVEWTWHPTGHPAGSIHGLVAMPDGGVLALGDTGQFGPGLLARIDANGDTVEQEWFDGPAYDLEQDAAGNLYVMHVVGGETPGCPSAYMAEAHLTKIAAGF